MNRPTALLVFYSRSGRTRAVAKAAAAQLGCDMEEIADTTDRHGLIGYLRSAFDATFRRPAKLRPLGTDPEPYDLVIVGTPVWNASVSAPVRTFLKQHSGRLHRVAFFLSHGSSGRRRVFAQMERLAGTRPLATMAVREAAIRRHRFDLDVQRFVDEIRAALHVQAPIPLTARATPSAAE